MSFMGSHGEYDQAASIDRMLYHEHSRMTVASSAFHQFDPSQLVIQIEEFNPRKIAVSERSALRNEIFGGFLEYLFAEGPEPAQVLTRIEGFIESFHPELAAKISGASEWVSSEAVNQVLRQYADQLGRVKDAATSRGSLFTWATALRNGEDADFVNETFVGLAEYLACEGCKRRKLVAIAFCLAKCLRPTLIASMSLHDIAILSADGGGRATPADRIKRIYNRKLEDAGFKACQVHFQKSATTRERCSAAQMGNSNRGQRFKKTKAKGRPC